MSENTENVSHTRPRRGLPRRPGEIETAASGQVSQTDLPLAKPTDGDATASPSALANPASAEPPVRRRGLPRPGQEASTAATPAATDAPAPTATPTAAPNAGRRAGLPRPGAPEQAAAQSAPTTNAAPASAGGRRAALGTNPATSNEPAPSASAPRRAGLNSSAAVSPQSPDNRPVATTPDSQPEAKPLALWLKVVIGVVGLMVLAGALVLFARWLRTLEPVQNFLVTYPGESHLPHNAPVGLPKWLGWQHFLNAFFIVLIIRTGWQVRTQQRPPAMWTRNNDGLIKTKNPPKKISLTLWTHLALDFLWFLNGIVFVIVLFATGQWMRVIPTSWDVFPNALSAALQYVSMNWPTENGWVNYNSLQLLAYFTTIFIAAPLAAITGVRMSGAWPAKAEKLNKVYPMELARAIHFPVMLYFTLFVIMHVFLVFSTGALRNLNHMYASQDVVSWTGFWIFFASALVMAGAVFAARPLILAPIAQLMGRVGR